MTMLRTSPRPGSRFALLLAALLHLLGAAAGPAVHVRLAERAVAAQEQREGERERPNAPVHDERSCAICQAHDSVGLPSAVHVLAVATSSADEVTADAPRAPTRRPADTPRARSPPILS